MKMSSYIYKMIMVCVAIVAWYLRYLNVAGSILFNELVIGSQLEKGLSQKYWVWMNELFAWGQK